MSHARDPFVDLRGKRCSIDDTFDLDISAKLRKILIEDSNDLPDKGYSFQFQKRNRKLTVKETEDDIKRIVRLAFNQKLDEALAECEEKSSFSLYHAYGRACIKAILATTLKKPAIQDAYDAFTYTTEFANSLRRKSWRHQLGLPSVGFLRPNYNDYSDEEVIAEMVYGMSIGAMGGFVFFIEGRSYAAFLSSLWYNNRAYRAYCECDNMLKNRSQWEDESCRRHFEGAVRLARGCLGLSLSFAPKSIKSLINMFGFSASSSKGLEDIKASANIREGLVYPVAVTTLISYYGFLLPVYGCGDVKLDVIEGLLNDLLDYDVYGGLNYVALGCFEAMKGNIEESIKQHKLAIPSLKHLGRSYLACYAPLAFNYTLLCDWKSALGYFDLVLNKKKLATMAPTMANYLYAVLLVMMMDDESRPELMPVIQQRLGEATAYKGIFIWKKVFFVPLILSRANHFYDKISSWMLPAFEVLYIGNGLYMIDKKPQYIDPFLERVNQKLDQISRKDFDFWEKYTNLIFMRGVLLKHIERREEAIECFQQVLGLENEIDYYKELIPQSCYEMGLIYKQEGNLPEASRWLKKMLTFRGYSTEQMFKRRALRTLKAMDKC